MLVFNAEIAKDFIDYQQCNLQKDSDFKMRVEWMTLIVYTCNYL